ncbi:cyclase family protein [Actinoplanes oblitus]|uniref:Cyclase family protein n=1 Tax=Actinoplanes oblitus TaxID=3040509 RepID=A0ABY8WQT8_9ACTN|nr:cyclase family protein [Actinoplanes oblitus]WIN00272.1 cyclase family protein [Actinoplanes oblitus]
MIDSQYRAVFDATVTFSNGGGLKADGFRVDLPGPEVTERQVGELFLASLGLLLTDTVEIANLRVVAEAHRGTRGGPSATGPAPEASAWRYVDLSHVVQAGMTTYPGLPGPEITPHLSRARSRETYAPGTEFTIDRISMVGNTGTYVDSPFHRYPDGTDLAGLPLESLAGLPAVVVRTAGTGVRGVGVGALAAHDVAGRAVLLHTGGDAGFGTADYARRAPYLTEDGARWLVEHGARLVGIDAVNIDDIEPDPSSGAVPGARPAHTLLLAAGIPIVEHLTGLGQVPPHGARFTAVPPRVAGFGTFPVRAYAAVPDHGE